MNIVLYVGYANFLPRGSSFEPAYEMSVVTHIHTVHSEERLSPVKSEKLT